MEYWNGVTGIESLEVELLGGGGGGGSFPCDPPS